MLYSKERHTEITSVPWNADQVMDFSSSIMNEAEKLLATSSPLPPHPLDTNDFSQPLSTMYYGVEGVAWGLQHWGQKTKTKLSFNPIEIFESRIQQHPEPDDVSYFFGKTGIRLAIQATQPSEKNLKNLCHDLDSLQNVETNEMMAGAPGALIAAQLLWEMNKESSPERICLLIPKVLGARNDNDSLKLPIWTQNYVGQSSIYIGAAHGAVGNIFSLLRASIHMNKTDLQSIREYAISLLKRTALENETEVNWPILYSNNNKEPLVHWCHGATGVVMQLATLLPIGIDSKFDELMIKAGNLIWKAGPLKKGANLCHGTSGSGAALLKLFERTGDEIWLQRARTLAMATLKQIEEDRETYKQPRYSLWTGDIGAVLFLQACTTGRFFTPMLDVI
ncbi:lanthionine synthetase C family protein [Peredibacter sp. HCB2-198]|uniref:lanthionine synthetase C family protein n=1 Tax=Peredibacter sp. HCB2-198 TaxID=3383025 RepID=UPI0038B5C9D1